MLPYIENFTLRISSCAEILKRPNRAESEEVRGRFLLSICKGALFQQAWRKHRESIPKATGGASERALGAVPRKLCKSIDKASRSAHMTLSFDKRSSGSQLSEKWDKLCSTNLRCPESEGGCVIKFMRPQLQPGDDRKASARGWSRNLGG